MREEPVSPLFKRRRAGILLHPTSLPGPYRGGDIGHCAYRFIEFLQAAGCSVWQMLPLGPTHEDGSPYQCLSVHAGNPLLISLDWLEDRKFLDLHSIDQDPQGEDFRRACLRLAGQRFFSAASPDWLKKFARFKRQQSGWLDDFALFMAIKQSQQGATWMVWPEALRHREQKALSRVRQQYAETIEQICFEQFIFFTQWHEIRAYANDHGVMLFGDMPIFVSHDSADVWAQRQNFMIDENGAAALVAGVPPDAFSDTGQRWGNPLYDWAFMKRDRFSWWHQRFATQLELFDLIRIDHFRGFEACWQIPAEEPTAINGEWVEVPGRALLQSLFDHFGNLALVAEDLGVITRQVTKLRKDFHLPGMKILQFAFGGDSKNPYLPHNHEKMSVVYTGTHDNNTTLGWYNTLDEHTRRHLNRYLGIDQATRLDMPWLFNRLALSSVARLVVLPLQDILSLDESHRMNIPGTTESNWLWRFTEGDLSEVLAVRLREMLDLYGRIPPV
jgi:4-alpha-glucanotransferase